MTELTYLAADYLAEALHSLEKARRAVQEEKVIRREAVSYELTQAQLSISRVVALIGGEPQ